VYRRHAILREENPLQNYREFQARTTFQVTSIDCIRGAPQRIAAGQVRWDYNENHPYRSLKGLSPWEYGQRAMATAADSSS
jgi:hypothetical protein